MSDTRRYRAIIALAVCLAVGVAAVVAYRETRTDERDRHAVRAEVKEIERAIRAHGADMWERVEAQHEGVSATPDEERSHQQMLSDFDRLGHIDGFAMGEMDVQLSGDTALLIYAVRGNSSRRGDPPAPAKGEFRLKKGPDGKWRMTAHRLIEAR